MADKAPASTQMVTYVGPSGSVESSDGKVRLVAGEEQEIDSAAFDALASALPSHLFYRRPSSGAGSSSPATPVGDLEAGTVIGGIGDGGRPAAQAGTATPDTGSGARFADGDAPASR